MQADLGDTMQSLYRQFGDIPGITIELHKELLAVRVDNDRASATVFLQGAQLAEYRRRDEQPIIWCSPLCDYRSGTPLRGGIPVCWPWFGDPGRNPEPVRQPLAGLDLSAHGLVRNRPWQLQDVRHPAPDYTVLTLVLELAQDAEPAWPHATRLTMTIGVGEQLSVDLEVLNNSDRAVAFSSALHSYFAVSDIDRVCIDGLEGLEYIDCLDDWSSQQQQGSLTFDREVDRIYHGTDKPITLVDRGWQRVIEVIPAGSNSAVIWNPWIEKSRRLSQFADDAYRSTLCIETANADRDYIHLDPAGSHRLAVTINCQPLS